MNDSRMGSFPGAAWLMRYTQLLQPSMSRERAMAASIALAVGLCAAGVLAGIIGVVSVAIRREEKNLTLTGVATGKVVRLGRRLNGVYVRTPRRTAAGDRRTTLV